MHPLRISQNVVFSDMHEYADAVVHVPARSDVAVVEPRPYPRRPPAWLPWWRGVVIGAPTLVLVGAVDHIGPVGPVTAAVWLGVNWWLY